MRSTVGRCLIVVSVVCTFCLACQRDEGPWRAASKQNTTEGYSQVLQRFPNSRHATEASEQRAWLDAVKQNTIESYSRFSVNYPTGHHVTEASEKAWLLAAKDDSWDAVFEFCRKFPKSPQASKARADVSAHSNDLAHLLWRRTPWNKAFAGFSATVFEFAPMNPYALYLKAVNQYLDHDYVSARRSLMDALAQAKDEQVNDMAKACNTVLPKNPASFFMLKVVTIPREFSSDDRKRVEAMRSVSYFLQERECIASFAYDRDKEGPNSPKRRLRFWIQNLLESVGN